MAMLASGSTMSKGRLGGGQRAGGEGRLEQEGPEHAGDDHAVDGPVQEQAAPALVARAGRWPP